MPRLNLKRLPMMILGSAYTHMIYHSPICWRSALSEQALLSLKEPQRQAVTKAQVAATLGLRYWESGVIAMRQGCKTPSDLSHSSRRIPTLGLRMPGHERLQVAGIRVGDLPLVQHRRVRALRQRAAACRGTCVLRGKLTVSVHVRIAPLSIWLRVQMLGDETV